MKMRTKTLIHPLELGQAHPLRTTGRTRPRADYMKRFLIMAIA